MSDPNKKHKNRQYLLIGLGVAGVLALSGAGMFFFDSGATTRRPKPQTVNITAPGNVEDKEAWRAQEAAKGLANEQKLSDVQGQLRQQQQDYKRLTEKLAEIEKEKSEAKLRDAEKTASESTAKQSSSGGSQILSSPLPAGKAGSLPNPRTPAELAAEKAGAPLNQPLNVEPPKRELEIIRFGKPAAAAAQAGAGGDSDGRLEVLGFPVDEAAKKFGLSKGRGASTGAGAANPSQIEFIPAGSFVRVYMLNGLDAPTGGQAQGNPLPVVFEVLDAANLPNKHKLDIRECRVTSAAWGDLSSERTQIRTEELSCVLGSGQSIEMPLKGIAIGEDGKAGLRGRLVSKQGSVLANAALAGIADGIGRAFNQSANTTSISPLGATQTINPNRVGEAALGSGVAKAASALEQYYLRAADKLYPVIETDGGRIVELLITKGAVYNGTVDVKESYRGMLTRAGSNSRRGSDD